MKPYLLALDQGTTSSRALLFDAAQHIVAMQGLEYPQIYPEPGWVEHDPMEILSSQTAVLSATLQQAGVSPQEIAAVGITNQRETVIVWEKATGKPIYNAIVWQCRRTSDMADQLYQDGYAPYIQSTTGLKPDAYFSATKIRWILDHVPGAQKRAEQGELCAGTVDTWLIWNFTKGKTFVTDYTNASRTMLFNIFTLQWDEELLRMFNIPHCLLPSVAPSSSLFGEITIDGTAIPIGGVAGDQQASLFGQACFEQGDVKNTYGTGCFLLQNTGSKPVKSRNGLLTTIAYVVEGKVCYALEGSVFNAGSVLQWLRDEMEVIQSYTEVAEICNSTPDTGGVYLVPAFSGLGTPYWDMRARGILVGLTRSSSRKHLVRAAQESIAYQVCDLIRAMEEDSGTLLRSIKVDGGGSRADFLLQFQADITNIAVLRGSCAESTALGAAFLAGLAVGYWKDMNAVAHSWKLAHQFTPQMPPKQREQLFHGWQRAVERSKAWEVAEEE